MNYKKIMILAVSCLVFKAHFSHAMNAEGIFNLVKEGDVTELRKYVTKDNVNSLREDGRYSLLYMACSRNKPVVIEFLLDQGAEINPRFYAPVLGSRDNDPVPTPLHVAAQQKNAKAMICLLIERGAQVNPTHTINSATPLHYAVGAIQIGIEDQKENIQALCQSGARINEVNAMGHTPLHTVSTLFFNEHYVHNFTPTMFENSYLALFEILVTLGADSAIQDDKKCTFFDYVSSSKYKYLMDKFKKIDEQKVFLSKLAKCRSLLSHFLVFHPFQMLKS